MGRRMLAALMGAASIVFVPVAAQGANGHANYHAVCPAPPSGYGHCHALVATDAHGNPRAQSAPYGLSPATIKSVYGFPTDPTAGAGKTIAIVDAYDDPTAEADLNTFSSQYGLPACTTANSCFSKANQSGGTSYPSVDAGWALEISLDVQWAHAIAPGAHILLVEASSSSLSDLLTAESYATAHADYVSNSWGTSEFGFESLYDSYFSQSSVFVSAGDDGTPAEWPSSSPNVISVGGTTLNLDSGGNLVSETGWSGGGGGCSSYENATSAQRNFSGYAQVGCNGRRATPDVSLDADPASGVSVYDGTAYGGQTGWWKVGGTSASAPMWAARSAVAGAVVDAGYVYGARITYRDITSGNNGAPCLTGYDLCTGRGSWTGGGTAPSPDFGISASPTTATVEQGTDATSTITISPSGGYTGTPTLSLAGGLQGSFTSLGSDSWTLRVTTTGATAGTYPLTVTATDGGLQHSTTFTVTVTTSPTANFALSVAPSPVVSRGGSGTSTVTVTWSNGSGSVNLSVSGLPRRTSASFNPSQLTGTGTSTLTVKANRNASPGNYQLTITATSGSVSHSTTVTLTIK